MLNPTGETDTHTPIPLIHRLSPTEAQGWLSALREAAPELAFCEFSELDTSGRERVQLAVVANPDPAELRTLPGLVWVHSLWAGVEHLLKDLQDLPLSIVRMEDPRMAETMAEAVLAWTLYLHRDMPLYRHQQTQRIWLQHPVIRPEARRIAMLGLGKMGAAAAHLLQQHGFDVRGWSRTSKDRTFPTFCGSGGLAEILSTANIVVVLLPSSPATERLLDAETIGQLAPGASIINFARGRLIDDAALLEALDRGHIKHAVLDVFEHEPLPVEHRYWHHPRITLLPHISAPTQKDTASAIVARHLRQYLAQGIMPTTVDRGRGY